MRNWLTHCVCPQEVWRRGGGLTLSIVCDLQWLLCSWETIPLSVTLFKIIPPMNYSVGCVSYCILWAEYINILIGLVLWFLVLLRSFSSRELRNIQMYFPLCVHTWVSCMNRYMWIYTCIYTKTCMCRILFNPCDQSLGVQFNVSRATSVSHRDTETLEFKSLTYICAKWYD